MRLLLLFTLCCLATQAQARDFQTELKRLQQDPQAAVNRLTALPKADLTAEQWLLLSHGYHSINNKEIALQSVNKALAGGLTTELQIEALEHKALIYGINYRDSAAALTELSAAERLLNTLDSPRKPELQTRIYESFAQGYNQRGDIDKAIRYAELSNAIAVEYQLTQAELESRLIAGRLMLQQNNYASAQQQLSRALVLAQQLKQDKPLASIHLRLGMAYHKLSQSQAAIEHLQQSEHWSRQTQNDALLLTAQLVAFDAWLESKQIDEAKQKLQQAEQTIQRLNDPQQHARLYYAQGQLAQQQQQFEQAEQLMRKSAQLFQQVGNTAMHLEAELAIPELALQQQQFSKALATLPQVENPQSLPVYLQLKLSQTEAKVQAAAGQWQQAYQATLRTSAAQAKLSATSQTQQLDSLRQQLQQQQQTEQLAALERTTTRQQWLLALALSLLALSWLGFVLLRQRPAQQPASPSQTSVKSWQAFSRQLRRDQQRHPALTLVAIQIQQVSEYKLQTGETLLRQRLRQVLEQLAAPSLLDYTVHTDVIWLSVAGIDENWQQQLTLVLTQVSQQLPAQPSIRVWRGQPGALLGTDWQEADLTGLRELVWYCWQQQQAKGQQVLEFSVSSTVQVPCSWQTDNIRQDINNALTLGLLQLEIKPLAA